MKKHFLLLMLMALLPFAGFAETSISEFEFRINAKSFEYTGETPSITAQVKSTELISAELTESDYDLVYFDENDTQILANEVVNVGTYKVAAQGKGTYTGMTDKITFTITKVNLAGSAITASRLVFTACRDVEEGEDAPTSATYDGKAWEPTATLTWTPYEGADEVTLSKDVDYKVSYGTNTNAGASAGTVTFTAKEGGNYEGSKTLTFAIAKIGIPAEGIVTAPEANSLTYNAAEQELVTAGKVANTESENYGTINYSTDGENWSTLIPKAKNYKEEGYTVYWKVVGGTNYNDTQSTAIENIAIAKGNITIIPIKKTKPYDGHPFTAADVKYSVAGRVGADASAAVSKINCTAVFNTAAGDYTITTDANEAEIGGVPMSANYIVTVKDDVKFTIEKKNLTISVKEISMTHGATDWPNLPAYDAENAETSIAAMKAALTINGAVTVEEDSEEDDMIKDLTFDWANGNDEILNDKEAGTIGVGSYDDAIKVSIGEEDVWNNYKVTIKSGTLKVNGAEFTIMPVIVSNIEYGDAYTIDYYASENATIDESTLTFVIGDKPYPYSNKANWELPTALDNYTVTIQDGVKGTLNNEGSTVVRQSNSYQIVAKKINITVKDQTVLKGDVAATFLNALRETDVECDDLANNDDFKALNVTFSFADDVTVDETGKITNDAGEVENAITLTVDNSNYEATVTAGKLTVKADFAVTLLADETASTEIAAAAVNGNKYTVKIGNEENPRTMKAKEWYAMVLPFDVTPAELVGALKTYVVVNTFKNAVLTSENKVHTYFKLEMEKIDAGTPFVIKPAAEVDWADATAFTDKIISSTIKKVGNADSDMAFFYGTYEAGKTIQWTSKDASSKEKYQWLSNTGFAGYPKNEWINPKSNSIELKPMEAYLILNSEEATGARVFVEDINENGTTAIKSLSADQVNGLNINAADGWYNLNGVKIEEPTQKGIYIHNGKKVVIK